MWLAVYTKLTSCRSSSICFKATQGCSAHETETSREAANNNKVCNMICSQPSERPKTPLKMLFTPAERNRLGVLINNISFLGSQLISQAAPELIGCALANLAKGTEQENVLLKRVDEMARAHSEESPLRLIEDLAPGRGDVAQMLTLVRRCLLASAFLGHCIALPNGAELPAEQSSAQKRLH